MRSLVQLSLSLVLVIIGSAFVDAQVPPVADYDPKAWREFLSPEGRFSVLLPGVPRKRVELSDSPVGEIDLHIFTLRTSNQSPQYDVSYIDFPESLDMSNLKAIFDNVRDDGVKAVRGKLLEEREDKSIGYPGRFYKVQTGDKNVMRIKAFLVKNRFYNLSYTTAGNSEPEAIAHSNNETAVKFLDSFRLLTEEELVKFEGEVDRLLKQIRDKEIILGRCGEEQECKPLQGSVFNGQVIKGDIIAGKIISKPQPTYPLIAKAARASGTVAVLVVIDEEGKVIAAQAESGHPLLLLAAIKAAREFRLTPTLLDGKPVKISGIIRYNFVLQ